MSTSPMPSMSWPFEPLQNVSYGINDWDTRLTTIFIMPMSILRGSQSSNTLIQYWNSDRHASEPSKRKNPLVRTQLERQKNHSRDYLSTFLLPVLSPRTRNAYRTSQASTEKPAGSLLRTTSLELHLGTLVYPKPRPSSGFALCSSSTPQIGKTNMSS